MKKYLVVIIAGVLLTACSNNEGTKDFIQGKTEKEQIAVVGKIAGRIQTINCSQGDFVRRGDTLAILDIPEVEAKRMQALGAVTSANAQYQMSKHGATANQLKQLNAKKGALEQQYEFAQKSLNRMEEMVKDSLIAQQQYDEVFAKYQGAQAQLIAVNAEIADVQNGVRIEQQEMALGQQDRAEGALQEVAVAEKERYIIAPQDMTIESITLKVGELALPGYTLFNGTLDNTIYFRFTLPESQLNHYSKGMDMEVIVPYKDNLKVAGVVKNIKPIGAYANIATAYPDYDLQDPLYEMTIYPKDANAAKDILNKTTVTIKNKL
ncbi:efflux RND transporter periplasmic adaptor subunit [Sphingobacterium sp. lm-10]|uniref:HlyD family secretion protein n=1 Tax=Sphingobacterium sp. lm-10 TaxID=2944904 RepID=UPI0020213BAA|nr:biotin/lipoyl-binding protein [Sphingobacterium sp. lm-10]MCL7986853.1 efflux RND transporter periplasmic adaptor subunit [Sphingobacterium sp. lm-10]